MRREERVTVQGPVKEQHPDGMSHGGAPEGGRQGFALCSGGLLRRTDATWPSTDFGCRRADSGLGVDRLRFGGRPLAVGYPAGG